MVAEEFTHDNKDHNTSMVITGATSKVSNLGTRIRTIRRVLQ